jgi:hypothetical protein
MGLLTDPEPDLPRTGVGLLVLPVVLPVVKPVTDGLLETTGTRPAECRRNDVERVQRGAGPVDRVVYGGKTLANEAIASVIIEADGRPRPAGALMWGQRLLWNDAQWLGSGDSHLNLAKSVAVPCDATMEHVLACVTKLVERHEVLRSRIVMLDDEPGQEVPGRIRMRVRVAALPAGDRSLLARMAQRSFRFPGDWPIDFAVGHVAGRPHTVFFVASQVAIDSSARDRLAVELTGLLRGAPVAEVTAHPLDRVAWERSLAGERTSARSLSRMEQQLRSLPQTMFAIPRHRPDEHRFRRMELRSPAISAALRTVAARCGVTTSAVLLAGTAAMLGRLTGNTTVVLKDIAGNRWIPALRTLIGVTLGNALYTFDLSEGSFDDLARAADKENLRSLLRSQCDPILRDRMVDRVNHERGIHVDLAAFFNDFRHGRDQRPAEGPGPDAPAGPTVTRWVGQWHRLDLKFYFHATSVDDGGERFFLTVDTAYIPSASVHPLLSGLERLLVEAARADRPLDRLASSFAGLPPVERTAGWHRIGGNWVEMDEVRGALGRAVGPVPSAVFVEPDDRLVAFVAGDDAVRPETVHHAVLRELAGHPTAVAPDLYVVCRPPLGDDPPGWDSRAAWDSMVVSRVGAGRGYHVVR